MEFHCPTMILLEHDGQLEMKVQIAVCEQLDGHPEAFSEGWGDSAST